MGKVSEKHVAGLWMSGKLAVLSDDLGNGIEVVCPGRNSTRPGCDFQDAVIRVNRQKVVGDIEVHVTSDLWLKHGHHRDPACNGVILHVALWQKGGLPVMLQDGRTLPTVILAQHIINVGGGALRARESCTVRPCLHGGGRGKQTDTVLLVEGLRRFDERVAAFAAALEGSAAGQVLYRGICRALGYARNKAAFEALADRLPLETVIKLAGNCLLTRQALLLGTAGLLPKQSGAAKETGGMFEAEELEGEWARLPEGIPAGRACDWSLALVRPVNHPVRRLVALSCLLQRYGEEGLVAGLKRLVGSAGGAKGLAEGLQVKADFVREPGCDDNNRQIAAPFGLAMTINRGQAVAMERGPAALIGRGRAGEIAINVVLPFFAALARRDKDCGLENRVLDTYLRYPALPGNELTGYMTGVLTGKRESKRGACIQQGMIRLYHQYCRVKDCLCCPVFISRRTARA